MPDWLTSDGAQLFFGAFVAVLTGWAANGLHSWWDTRARRDLLFRMLVYQLKGIDPNPPPFDPVWPITRDAIYITAADQLLSTHVINPRKERALLSALTMWQARAAGLNQLILITNHAIVTQSIPPALRSLRHEQLNEYHRLMLALRGDVFNGLPAKYRPGELAPDSGLLMVTRDGDKGGYMETAPTEDQQ